MKTLCRPCDDSCMTLQIRSFTLGTHKSIPKQRVKRKKVFHNNSRGDWQSFVVICAIYRNCCFCHNRNCSNLRRDKRQLILTKKARPYHTSKRNYRLLWQYRGQIRVDWLADLLDRGLRDSVAVLEATSTCVAMTIFMKKGNKQMYMMPTWVGWLLRNRKQSWYFTCFAERVW